MNEVQKRGRGRPRKPQQEPKEKRPRGRPRKPIDENAVIEKRPRGRPRKYEITEQKEKRPRGRPRKYEVENEIKQDLNNLQQFEIQRETEIVQNDVLNEINQEIINESIENMQKVEVEQPIQKQVEINPKTTILNAKKVAPAKHLKSEEIAETIIPEQPSISLNPDMPDDVKPNISKSHLPVIEEEPEVQAPIQKTAFTNVNKVIVVTGATSGQGFAMAKNLAGLGQTVIAVGRRPSLCRDARNEILDAYPDANIHYLVADLSLMSQVRILADEIKSKLADLGRDSIDVLIHNAGVQTNVHKVTYENHELMWATNYLAVFLLTRELQPLLDRSRDARVITITSQESQEVELDWEDIKGSVKKANDDVYHQTKLAVLMFALEYDHRYADRKDLHAYCVDPGLVNTELRTKNTSGLKRLFAKSSNRKAKTIEQGIETTMYLTLAEKLPSNVVLYANKKATEPCRYALDPRNRSALWRYTELDLQN